MNAHARRMLPLAAVGIVSMGLSGCFSSQHPLISKEQADYAFKIIRMRDERGEETVLTRDGDSYVLTGQPNGKIERNILLYKINENLYAIQQTDDDGAGYYFAKRAGNEIAFQGQCHNLEDDELRELNIEVGPWPALSCRLENLDALIRLGQSAAIWSRDTRKIEIITIE